MSRLGKTIISLVSAGIVAVCGILLYVFWPAITGTINKNKYYTSEDIQSSYDKGFDDGNKSETELTAEIIYYKSLIDEYESEVRSLNKEISDLITLRNQSDSTLQTLTSVKAELESQVDDLSNLNNENNVTIANLNIQINDLKNQVSSLSVNNHEKDKQISQLNNQITNLQNTVNQLQLTNEMNLNSITNLNTQIANLNNQISDMSMQTQNSNGQITALNNKINELQASVNYYESYIASLETGEQVVATFEYDGSVYNIQIANKGSKLTFPIPEDTRYKVFNGWKVGDEFIDPTTYTLYVNTKFVADITYKYDVKFMVGDIEHNSQLVVKNTSVVIPEIPIKEGYEFDGWSLNGVDVIDDINNTQVTENITYVAVFTKIHSVTFIYEDNTVSTQSIRNGSYASFVNIEDETYKVFNGWKTDNNIVDVNSYKIVKDTIFVADITYKFDVIFIVDDAEYNSQIVAYNYYPSIPVNPVKDGYFFDGWTINGIDVINVANYQIIESTTFIAKFSEITYLTTVEQITFTNLNKIYGPNVWHMDEQTYFSQDNRQYVFDKDTRTWNVITWSGLSSFDGQYVWTDGVDYYYSESTLHYIFNKETNAWETKTWTGHTKFHGTNIWSYGGNTYLTLPGYNYILNKETKDWDVKIWEGYVPQYASIWTDGIDYYYSHGANQYVLNQVTETWESKTWYGMTSFNSGNIYIFGGNVYYSYSSDQYMLNKETNTWEVKKWLGLTWYGGAPKNIYASGVWTDGTNLYYSDNSDWHYLFS